ncbi:uncharacterized protein [Haliotis cracherodii]|uniref:uncharacterized protein n=1 Tax=Haliotis cracherodii TaxID=6455 RepID=UPI0039EBF8F5
MAAWKQRQLKTTAELKPTAAPQPAHDAPEHNDYEDPIYAVPHQVLGVSSSHQPTAGGQRPLNPTDSSVESSPKTNHNAMTIQLESPSETEHNAMKSQLESSAETDNNVNAMKSQLESSPETYDNTMTIQLESSAETDNNAAKIQVESSPETVHSAPKILIAPPPKTEHSALSPSCGSLICDTADEKEIEGDFISVCYDEGSKQIKCPRNESLLIKRFLQRAHVRKGSYDKSADYKSCSPKFTDELYDIGGCLLNTSDVSQKTAYQAAITEVMEECSQKRYCILESDKNPSIDHLKDLHVGEGKKRPSHLVVIHQCVKDGEASMTLCEKMTISGKEVYISSNRLKMTSLETSTCNCTVSGAASRVTLLDVRLGNSHVTTLSIRDETRTAYTIHGGDQAVHFMKEITISQSEWSLWVDVIRDYLPDKIWMRVEGHNGSDVTVTCKAGTKTAPNTNRSGSTDSDGSNLQLVFLAVGFLAGVVAFGIIFILYVKRRQGNTLSASPPHRVTPEGNDALEPIYSLPHQHRGTDPPRQLSTKSCSPDIHNQDDPDCSVALKPNPNPLSLSNLTIDKNKLRFNTEP